MSYIFHLIWILQFFILKCIVITNPLKDPEYKVKQLVPFAESVVCASIAKPLFGWKQLFMCIACLSLCPATHSYHKMKRLDMIFSKVLFCVSFVRGQRFCLAPPSCSWQVAVGQVPYSTCTSTNQPWEPRVPPWRPTRRWHQGTSTC